MKRTFLAAALALLVSVAVGGASAPTESEVEDANQLAKMTRIVGLPGGDTGSRYVAVTCRYGHHLWIVRADLDGATLTVTDYAGIRPDLYSPSGGERLYAGDAFPMLPMGVVVRENEYGWELVVLEQMSGDPTKYSPARLESTGGNWGYSCYAWNPDLGTIELRDCDEGTIDDLMVSLKRNGTVADYAIPDSVVESSLDSWTSEVSGKLQTEPQRKEELARGLAVAPPIVIEEHDLGPLMTQVDLDAGWHLTVGTEGDIRTASDNNVVLSLVHDDGPSSSLILGSLANKVD